jgi:hypothetical protein
MAITLVGSNIQSSSASSYTVSFPTGTAAGNIAFVFCGHGYAVNNPSGWILVENKAGANFNGAVFAKVLTAGDVSAGSMTVTTAGAYNGVLAIAVFSGVTPFVVASESIQSGGSTTSVNLTGNYHASTSFPSLYFGGTRGATTCAVTVGTSLQAINAANASGCLYEATVTANAGFTFAAAGTGYYVAGVIFTDSSGGGGGGGGGAWTWVS